MLAVRPLRRTKDEIENQGEMDGFSIIGGTSDDDFGEFSDGNLLESINFDDLFVNVAGDVLPDLEMDPEILAELSMESSENMNSLSVSMENNDSRADHHQVDTTITTNKEEEEEDKDRNNKASSASGSNYGSCRGGEEIVSKREESETTAKPSSKEADKGRKSSAQSKNSHGKKKAKVDWTPELHRRFVQAVEQLGVDKAVPSRILEIMGIGCLTRHNIASHLQKYRSHRKHLLAREAEAASWSKRREMYGGGGKRSEASPWVAPTMGFPQMTAPMHHFRPLHVWGHPTVDHSFVPMWPKHHLPHPLLPPPPAWLPPTVPPPPDPSFWHPHHQQADPNALTAGTGAQCFPKPLTTTRFGSPPVPGIPPHAMFKVDSGIGIPTGQPGARPWPVSDFLPSKESIDAAIGDVISKPWLPLPLGLKAPALDSVLGELQRQGIQKIPPSCA